MTSTNEGYMKALLEGLLVTFLWSTSYILVKIGLGDVPPLTLVAYRYVIASATLFALSLPNLRKRSLPRENATKSILLGISGYAVAQGLQCIGLFFLPAVTATFILNFTPIMVLSLGLVFLKEYPTLHQLVGTALALVGVCFFFSSSFTRFELTGILVILFSGLGWAVYMVASRRCLRQEEFDTVSLTLYPMGFGAIFLLIAATLTENLPAVTTNGWTIILWLSFVNTALAFLLWNRALSKIEAFKLSILQNTMLIQIAILASLFLGEQITQMKTVALILVFIGILLVQIAKKNQQSQ